MNVTAQITILAAAAVLAIDAGAEEPVTPVRRSAPPNTANADGANVPLTNKALLVIAKLRGVEPAAIKLRTSAGRVGGAFEIDVMGAKDAAKEAEELSKVFGTTAAVILEQVSNDGVIRTNWTFKNGTVRQLTAPVGKSGLGAGARRMYVWPEPPSKPPAAPSKLRVRESIN